MLRTPRAVSHGSLLLYELQYSKVTFCGSYTIEIALSVCEHGNLIEHAFYVLIYAFVNSFAF